MPLHATENHIN